MIFVLSKRRQMTLILVALCCKPYSQELSKEIKMFYQGKILALLSASTIICGPNHLKILMILSISN